MFTPIKRALTALTITASLLTPISANAEYLDHEASTEVLTKGKILSVDEGGRNFVIEYRGKIIMCYVTRSPASNAQIFLQCIDDQPE